MNSIMKSCTNYWDENPGVLFDLMQKLAHRYTRGESTSVSYETAERLMEAVLYALREYQETASPGEAGAVSVDEAYRIGCARLKEKTEEAAGRYHLILKDFCTYGNRALEETIQKGMPAFFRCYDPEFDPTNSILLLDYPVLADLSELSGVNKILEYLRCIQIEQAFLSGFPEDYVIDVLKRYSSDYEEQFDNLCQIVLQSVLLHLILGKKLTDHSGTEQEMQMRSEKILRSGAESLSGTVRVLIGNLCRRSGDAFPGMEDYLAQEVDNFCCRIENCAKYHRYQMFFDLK
ncbi:MAG: DUF6179 domain-containing protein [Fusicatenibacter sp.]